MKKMFSDVRNGDKVWSTVKGWGEVKEICTNSFGVQFSTSNVWKYYNHDGYCVFAQDNGVLFWDEINIPERPKRKVKKVGYLAVRRVEGVGFYILGCGMLAPEVFCREEEVNSGYMPAKIEWEDYE